MPVPYEIAESLRARKAQYTRHIDTKDWSSLKAFFHPTATFAFLNPDGSLQTLNTTRLSFSSPQSFISFLSRIFANTQTLHMLGQGEFEMVGEDESEVEAIWGMEDRVIVRGVMGLGGLMRMSGGGYYHERWVKMEDGNWALKNLRLERTYLRWSFMAGLGMLMGRWLGIDLI